MNKHETIKLLRDLRDEMRSRGRDSESEALRTALYKLEQLENWSSAFLDLRGNPDEWAQRADMLWGLVRSWAVNRVYTPEDIRAFYTRQYGCEEGADQRIDLMVQLFRDYLAAFDPGIDAAPAGNAAE